MTSPSMPLAPDGHEGEKKARKLRKRELRFQRDAQRPPDSFERWRILAELVNEGRRVVEIADHKARYALVVMGILNAGMLLAMSRHDQFGSIPDAARPWLIRYSILYVVLSFLFVWYAVDCLRPRQLNYDEHLRGNGSGAARHGLLYWEAIAASRLEDYQHAWTDARMEQLNGEVVIIAHHLAGMITRKYQALGRLYFGLALLIAMAAVLLTAFVLLGAFV